MADEPAEEVVEKKPKPLLNLLVAAVVGFVSGTLGFGTMMILMPSGSSEEGEGEVDKNLEKAFIPFGEISCNVNDGQLNRFLKLAITLQFECEAPRIPELESLVAKEKPILTSWLLSYLADMKMDDIRGAVGQNRLRREIQNHFSAVLFPDADGQIEDLLFEAFIVQ
ncbi:flagellar basal body-associated protein FliL [Planctomycetota bacterium]